MVVWSLYIMTCLTCFLLRSLDIDIFHRLKLELNRSGMLIEIYTSRSAKSCLFSRNVGVLYHKSTLICPPREPRFGKSDRRLMIGVSPASLPAEGVSNPDSHHAVSGSFTDGARESHFGCQFRRFGPYYISEGETFLSLLGWILGKLSLFLKNRVFLLLSLERRGDITRHL
ncbi:hypothetical protein PO909_024046 [Leuciscus waleckii]